MSPVLLTSAALSQLLEERDPVWEAVLASPVVEDDLSVDERAALDAAMVDLQAGVWGEERRRRLEAPNVQPGRVVSRDRVVETIERLRREQGE